MTADLIGPAFSGTAEIRFTVPLVMLSEKEIAAGDIAAYQFAQGTWKQLPVSPIEEVAANVYLERGMVVPPTQTQEITSVPTTVPPTAVTTWPTTVPTVGPTRRKHQAD